MFPKRSACKDGYSYWCKICHKDYNRTKPIVINIIYNSQRRNSADRNHKPPAYTKLELYDWLVNDWLFNILYDNWCNCGYLKNNKPSIDRIDDYKGYSFDNIQIMTWGENNLKHSQDRKNGINNKISISVSKYTMDNIFIRDYVSISIASRDTGAHDTSIKRCCDNKYGFKSAGGFIWKYAKV